MNTVDTFSIGNDWVHLFQKTVSLLRIQIKSGPCETLEMLCLLKYQVKHIPRDLFKLKFFCILLRCLRKKPSLFMRKCALSWKLCSNISVLFCRMNADRSPFQKNRRGSSYLLLAFLNIVNITHFFLNYSRVCRCQWYETPLYWKN